MGILGMTRCHVLRRVRAALLFAATFAASAANASPPGADLGAASAKVGTPLTRLQSCDASGKTVLAGAAATHALYLVRLDGDRVAVSQPLIGRTMDRGEYVDCGMAPPDGLCFVSCAAGPSGIQFTYGVNYDWTRQNTAQGQERLVFDVAVRDGAFLVERLSKVIGTREAEGFGWQVQTYEEKVDFTQGRYATAFVASATPSEERPSFDQGGRRPLAQGRALVAAPDFDPNLAFSDFRIVHGKAAWKGPLDLSALAFVRWQKDKLTFRITVKDDVVKPGSSLAADHIEIWSSRNRFGDDNTLRRKGGFEDRQFLLSMVDGAVVVTPTLPTADKPQRIEGHYALERGGYTIEFSLPAALLLPSGHQGWRGIEELDERARQRFFEGDVMPFTLIVSDGDGAGQKALLSTSELKWNTPTTFGRLVLTGSRGFPELSRTQATEELGQY